MSKRHNKGESVTKRRREKAKRHAADVGETPPSARLIFDKVSNTWQWAGSPDADVSKVAQ
jgi:hypothetical protein